MTDQENNKSQEPSSGFKDLDRKHKIALLVLGILAVGIFVVWIMKFNKIIESPFVYQGEIPEESKNKTGTSTSEPEKEPKSKMELMNQDTDGDGLSDWDEKNIYNTSIYLKDTDGDGINDYEEVKQGTNPNCAQGEECNSAQDFKQEKDIEVEDGLTSDMSDMSQTEVTSTESLDSSSQLDVSGQDEETLQKMLQGDLSIDELRQVLQESGFPKERLEQLSDEQLEQVYQESFQEFSQESQP